MSELSKQARELIRDISHKYNISEQDRTSLERLLRRELTEDKEAHRKDIEETIFFMLEANKYRVDGVEYIGKHYIDLCIDGLRDKLSQIKENA